MLDQKNVDRSARPRRKTNLIEVQADGDLLLYDETTHRAYCLKSDMAAIWQQCDGETGVDQIIGAEDDSTRDALLQLHDDELITGLPSMERPRAMSRRSLVQAGGAVAAGVIFAPMLESIIVPQAAAAASAFPQNSGGGGSSVDGGSGSGGDFVGDGGSEVGLGKGRRGTGGKGDADGKGGLLGRVRDTDNKSGADGKGGLLKRRRRHGTDSKVSVLKHRRGTGPHGSKSNSSGE